MFKGINSKALKKAQEKLNSTATSSKKASLKFCTLANSAPKSFFALSIARDSTTSTQ